jgi:hypothetical protein
MGDYSEERIAALLRLLRPAPFGWVRAAQELPAARAELDEIVARAEADAAFQQALIVDLEGALVAEGYTARDAVVAELRARLVEK